LFIGLGERSASGCRATRTLSYDRAGFGGSDDDPQPRSLERLVVDLAAVLDQVEPDVPVVLVGSSLGGAIIRMFSMAHPQRVAGLVFVDAAVAEATPAWHMRRLRRAFSLVAALSRLGLHRRLIMAAMKPVTEPSMPTVARSVLVRDLTSARNVRTAAREAREVGLSVATLLRLQSKGLPDVPVTTLVGARVGSKESAELRGAMLDSGRREMKSHSRGRFVSATRSSHAIPSEEPELLAEEIRQVVRIARQPRR
jgi:pimeloyl-ACP methyl ester carboxylesterase